MKKFMIFISVILLIIIIISMLKISENRKILQTIKQENKQYEQYAEKEIYGTDVITLINKAINNNEKNNIQKDKEHNYQANNENSITIDIVMITDQEKEETTTYKMETINKVGISEFISNFNTAKFKITKIEYHKQTGKIKHIEIAQQYE